MSDNKTPNEGPQTPKPAAGGRPAKAPAAPIASHGPFGEAVDLEDVASRVARIERGIS